MDVHARNLRTVLASTGTAHAAAQGLDVNFEPLLGGLGIRVEVVDTVGAGKQNCSYDFQARRRHRLHL